MDSRSHFYQSFKRNHATIVDEHRPAFTISQRAHADIVCQWDIPEMFPESTSAMIIRHRPGAPRAWSKSRRLRRTNIETHAVDCTIIEGISCTSLKATRSLGRNYEAANILRRVMLEFSDRAKISLGKHNNFKKHISLARKKSIIEIDILFYKFIFYLPQCINNLYIANRYLAH